jgi:phospholipid/cholesterol/gamma-HCH transport system permease protein
VFTVAERLASGSTSFLGRLGRATLTFVAETGRVGVFFARTLWLLLQPPFRFRAVLEQIQFVGNRSVLIVALTSAFTGLVLTLQGYNALLRFGAERMVGALVSLSLVRELAPVLAALMITARAGSAIAATLGNMRVTEQMDALETMAIDPISYAVVPRVWASIISVPLLTAAFALCGLWVAQLFGAGALGLDAAGFRASVYDAIEFSDVVEALTKSSVFSLVIACMATYRGFHASGGAKGVGQATTRAVVETSVLVLGLDYSLTALLF